jgi:hypothetical protein
MDGRSICAQPSGLRRRHQPGKNVTGCTGAVTIAQLPIPKTRYLLMHAPPSFAWAGTTCSKVGDEPKPDTSSCLGRMPGHRGGPRRGARPPSAHRELSFGNRRQAPASRRGKHGSPAVASAPVRATTAIVDCSPTSAAPSRSQSTLRLIRRMRIVAE